MSHVVCPGSFDPPTRGHTDVIARAAALFDEVTALVIVNPEKTGLFAADERMAMLSAVTATLPAVRVEAYTGLLVDYCSAHGVDAIVKGLRGGVDFDYETQMALMNRHLTGVETILLPADPAVSFVSSTLVRQIAGYGGDVDGLVDPVVAEALAARLRA